MEQRPSLTNAPKEHAGASERRKIHKAVRKPKKTYQLEPAYEFKFSTHIGTIKNILTEEIERYSEFLKGNYVNEDIMKAAEGVIHAFKSLQKAMFPRFKLVCHIMVGSKVECSGNAIVGSRCLWDPKLGDCSYTLTRESPTHFMIFSIYGMYME